jgi:hypothetical protein
MGFIWMHMLHPIRGVYGLFLVIKKTPKTYELIESISDFNDDQLDEHWGFEKMAKHVRDNFKKHMINLLSKDKNFFICYAIFSWINIMLDLIGFLIQLIRFGTSGDEYSDLFMMAVVIIFIYTILNYFFWMFSFYIRIEPKYRKDAMRAAMGFSSGLAGKFEESYKGAKDRMFPKNAPPNPPKRGLGAHRNED